MKRIIAALTGKVEKLKMERKINRLNRAIEAAKDNAQDEIERLEEAKSRAIASVNYTDDTNAVVEKIADLIDQQEDCRTVLDRLDKVKAYLEEDVKVQDEQA